MFVLRKYQLNAVEAGIRFFNNTFDNKNALIVIPTGGGKSLVIANIAKELKGNTIVFQPRKELLEQNYAKFIAYGGKAAIYSASKGIKKISKITYATIGSVVSKPQLFRNFNYCIIDEAHLVPPNKTSMYSRFLAEMNIKILGLTATPIRLKTYNYPERHSKLCMLDRMRPRVFQKYIHITQIRDLLKDKFFSPTKYVSFDFDRSVLKVNTSGADFTEQSIHEAIISQSINDKAIHYGKLALQKGRKHILIFVPNISDAQYIAQKTGWAYVCGTTKKIERERILAGFKSGTINGVANVGILTVGFDFPELDTIILARPTMSLALYCQMLGRGVRPAPGKKDCLFIDLVGNYETFGRIEDLTVEYRKGWGMFSGDRQLTNVDMTEEVIVNKPEIIEPDKLDGNAKMTFGKHKGEKLKKIPKEYLQWIYDNVERRPYNKFIFDFIEKTIINFDRKH